MAITEAIRRYNRSDKAKAAKQRYLLRRRQQGLIPGHGVPGLHGKYPDKYYRGELLPPADPDPVSAMLPLMPGYVNRVSTWPDPVASAEAVEQRLRVGWMLKTLTYRERETIKMRYGMSDGITHTLDEVGHIFKITRERLRQVEAKAIRKLQHPMRVRKLATLLDFDQNQPPTKAIRHRWDDLVQRKKCRPIPPTPPA